MIKIYRSFSILCLMVPCLWQCKSQMPDQAKVANEGDASAPGGTTKLFAEIVAEVGKAPEIRSTIPWRHTVTHGNYVAKKPFIRGPEIFAAFNKRIREAQKEVLIAMFTWETDSVVSQDLVESIASLCQRTGADPIDVRILIGNTLKTSNKVIQTLRQLLHSGPQAPCADKVGAKVQIEGFESIALDSLHSKYLVVDGRWTIVTGANVQKVHDGDKRPWYDLAFEFWGPVAQSVRLDFIDAWLRSQAPAFNIQLSEVQKEALAALQGLSWQWPHDLGEAPLSSEYVGDVPLALVNQREIAMPQKLANSPQDLAYEAVFAKARRNIHIQTPNFNADGAWYGLLGPVSRGVKVRMIVSKGFNFLTESLPGQKGNNFTNVRDFYKELGPNFVHPNFDARWFTLEAEHPEASTPATPVFALGESKPHSSHAKYLSADDQIAIIGSANMDTQSWYQSRELNVLVDSAVIVKAWEEAIFTKNLSRAVRVCQPERHKNGCAYEAPLPEGPNW
jgi:phosphatidylserine/phosphatidylglycerophosphate/cardiolipin synthase-like enzyme